MTEDLRIVLSVNDVDYVIEASDIDGLEWRDIKRATSGMTPKRVFEAAAEMDFEALGALLWIVRRRDEKKLTLEQVLKSLSISSMDFPDGDEVPPTGDADS